MKNQIHFLLVPIVSIMCLQCTMTDQTQWSVESPDHSLSITVTLDAKGGDQDMASGRALRYRVESEKGETTTVLILPSPLGIVREDQVFDDDLFFDADLGRTVINETYTMTHGKQLKLVNFANEATLQFRTGDGAKLQLILRTYNDGVAFRYRFPEERNDIFTVTDELTSFSVPSGGRTWIQPYDTVTTYTPAYETYFTNAEPVGTDAPMETGWSFPALFFTCGHWMLITEADLDDNYFGAHLNARPAGGVYRIQLPLPGEGEGTGHVQPEASLPWTTPWRVIIVGDNPGSILESNLVYHLSTPSKIDDTGWIQPGRASWSWWSDHPSSRNFNSLKSFIDLAADMEWEYSLVDANWNIMEGGNIEELIAYAKEKSVGILMWYNSGGPHNTVTEQPRDIMYDPESRRLEFQKLQEWGVRGVKVDFFQSDKQNIIRHYLDILADAADYEIMVNFHGCTMPRGWERTWPHLMTMEAVRGAESYSFGPEYPEYAYWHNTILPFTRNVVGSMDYTPVAFSDQRYPHLTTYGHELALSVVFESGILHMADAVESYVSLPPAPKALLQNVPVAWDETRYLVGEPGTFVVLARRHGQDWHVAGINGQDEEVSIDIEFSFLETGPYDMTLIEDGPTDRSFNVVTDSINTGDAVPVTMRPRGGFVIRLEK